MRQGGAQAMLLCTAQYLLVASNQTSFILIFIFFFHLSFTRQLISHDFSILSPLSHRRIILHLIVIALDSIVCVIFWDDIRGFYPVHREYHGQRYKKIYIYIYVCIINVSLVIRWFLAQRTIILLIANNFITCDFNI